MKSTLRIFVAEDCPNCTEARTIAARVEQDYPSLAVEVVDIGDEQSVVPDVIFATPTFMLNDRVVSLGNPKFADIASLLG